MSTVRRVASNTSILLIGNIIFRIMSLFVVIYLARYLGIAEFGKFSFVFAYLAFFSVLTDLGLQTILVREMSRDESIAPKLIGNAYLIRLVLTIFAVVLSMVVITLMSYPPDTTTYIYIATFSVFFISFSNFYSTTFQANLRMEYNIFAKLVSRIISAILIFWIIFSHGTLMQVMIVLVFSEMIKTLISVFYSRKLVKAQFKLDFGLWKYLLKESLPIALSSVVLIIYNRIDVLMLSLMKGDADVGIYSAAYKLSEPLMLIPYALTLSLFPVMSAFFKRSDEGLIKSYRLGVKYFLIITLPIAVGTTLLADKIILVIYGTTFVNSITVLQILIWTLVLASINQILIITLISIKKQKLNTLSNVLCVIVNVALNLILIPLSSYNGAAFATVVTNIVLFAASFYFVSKNLQMISMHRILIKPLIGSLIMGAFVYIFIKINLFLLVSSSAVVYLLVLLLLKTFSREDVDILRKVLGRKGSSNNSLRK